MHDRHGREHGSRLVGMDLEQWLRAHILKENHRQREHTGKGMGFETSNPTPSDTPPPTRPHLLILPNSSTNWGSSIKACEYGVQVILIQITIASLI